MSMRVLLGWMVILKKNGQKQRELHVELHHTIDLYRTGQETSLHPEKPCSN